MKLQLRVWCCFLLELFTSITLEHFVIISGFIEEKNMPLSFKILVFNCLQPEEKNFMDKKGFWAISFSHKMIP